MPASFASYSPDAYAFPFFYFDRNGDIEEMCFERVTINAFSQFALCFIRYPLQEICWCFYFLSSFQIKKMKYNFRSHLPITKYSRCHTFFAPISICFWLSIVVLSYNQNWSVCLPHMPTKKPFFITGYCEFSFQQFRSKIEFYFGIYRVF